MSINSTRSLEMISSSFFRLRAMTFLLGLDKIASGPER